MTCLFIMSYLGLFLATEESLSAGRFISIIVIRIIYINNEKLLHYMTWGFKVLKVNALQLQKVFH